MLLDFYRGAYFHPGTDAPRTVAIADPSEYFVAQAVVTAGAHVLVLVWVCARALGWGPGGYLSTFVGHVWAGGRHGGASQAAQLPQLSADWSWSCWRQGRNGHSTRAPATCLLLLAANPLWCNC